MNNKAQGEYATKIVIAELAKLGIDIALPMSDNLPFDLVAILNGKLYKVQVKSSTQSSSGTVLFTFRRVNWWKKTAVNYSFGETDILIGYDMYSDTCYVFEPDQFVDKSTITLRKIKTKNNQLKNCNAAADYILCKDRITKILQ
jgi:hypothetical protein